MRCQICSDFIGCIDPGDRAYFCRSREGQLGMNFFVRLRQFRAIATRYNKTALNFLAAFHLVAAAI
jgi:hypothetical protein